MEDGIGFYLFDCVTYKGQKHSTNENEPKLHELNWKAEIETIGKAM